MLTPVPSQISTVVSEKLAENLTRNETVSQSAFSETDVEHEPDPEPDGREPYTDSNIESDDMAAHLIAQDSTIAQPLLIQEYEHNAAASSSGDEEEYYEPGLGSEIYSSATVEANRELPLITEQREMRGQKSNTPVRNGAYNPEMAEYLYQLQTIQHSQRTPDVERAEDKAVSSSPAMARKIKKEADAFPHDASSLSTAPRNRVKRVPVPPPKLTPSSTFLRTFANAIRPVSNSTIVS